MDAKRTEGRARHSSLGCIRLPHVTGVFSLLATAPRFSGDPAEMGGHAQLAELTVLRQITGKLDA